MFAAKYQALPDEPEAAVLPAQPKKDGMQRCPYLHEMRERLLGDTPPPPPPANANTAAAKPHPPKSILVQPHPPPSIATSPPSTDSTGVCSPVRTVTAKYSTTPTAEKAEHHYHPYHPVHPEAVAIMDRRYNGHDAAHQVGCPIGTVVKVFGWSLGLSPPSKSIYSLRTFSISQNVFRLSNNQPVPYTTIERKPYNTQHPDHLFNHFYIIFLFFIIQQTQFTKKKTDHNRTTNCVGHIETNQPSTTFKNITSTITRFS